MTFFWQLKAFSGIPLCFSIWRLKAAVARRLLFCAISGRGEGANSISQKRLLISTRLPSSAPRSVNPGNLYQRALWSTFLIEQVSLSPCWAAGRKCFIEQKAPAKAFHVEDAGRGPGSCCSHGKAALPAGGGGHLVLLRGINEQRREAGRGERRESVSLYI